MTCIFLCYIILLYYKRNRVHDLHAKASYMIIVGALPCIVYEPYTANVLYYRYIFYWSMNMHNFKTIKNHGVLTNHITAAKLARLLDEIAVKSVAPILSNKIGGRMKLVEIDESLFVKRKVSYQSQLTVI